MREEDTQRSINTWAAWRPLLKPLARVLVLAQVALALQPLSVLAQEKGQAPYNPVAQAQLQRLAQLNQSIEQAQANRSKTPADAVSDKLVQAQELVARLRSPHTPNKPEQHRQLKALLGELTAGAADVRAEFAATRAHLEKKKLPAEILARHDDAVRQFEDRAAQFARIASDPDTDESRVAKLAEFFDKFPNKRKPGKFDPKKLPWSTPQPNKRPPAETKLAWFQNLYGDQKIRLAQAGGTIIGPLQFTIPPEPGQAPTEADLAETDEVQITQEIRTKAAELGNNPVNIYNWVRNNIEWVPMAGAIQSAQDTLDKKRGNATDTASLLIALLRAANIPARYQWGTIDVEASKAMNWVGGVSKPEAALQILNQGGIAARAISSGGRLSAIRMEHVWVNAYVNWSPARGSRNATNLQHTNPNGALNAWIPMDGAFKQYVYTSGMNVPRASPLNGPALIAAARDGAVVNTQEGWVRNLNYSAIEGQITNYQTQLQSFVNATVTAANSTVGDVLGRKVVSQSPITLLPGTTSNVTVSAGAESSFIPAAFQHRFTYSLFVNITDQAESNPLLTYEEKTSKLVGKRLTITYVPASQADADIIGSYLPVPHADGSPILPSELPASLPGYLIRLRAQVNLEGQVVAQASQALPMGSDLYSTGGFTQLYDTSQWDLTSEETNTVGNASAIGISAAGVSGPQVAAIESRLGTVKSLLQARDFENVKGEGLTGDLLSAITVSWFGAAENLGRLGKGGAGVVENAGLSYGLAHVLANAVYSWGIISKVTFPGMNLDIGHVRYLTLHKDNDPQRTANYNRLRGVYLSYLEAEVPERLFAAPDLCNLPNSTNRNPSLGDCTRGISAARAIHVAGSQGQRVFTFTRQLPSNTREFVESQLAAHSEATIEKVQQSLDAGYDVTIHQAPVILDGWTGAGFSAVDPATGAGAYLLDGGSNGGALLGKFVLLITIALIVMAIVAAFALFAAGMVGALSLTLAVAAGMYGYASLIQGLLTIDTESQFYQLTGGIGLAAFASLLLAGFTAVFYDVFPSVMLGGFLPDVPLNYGAVVSGLSFISRFLFETMFGSH